MKKIFAVAIAATTMLATPAVAQQATDDASFEVTASVPGTCTIGNPGTIALSSLGVNTTAGANALTLVNSGSYVADQSAKFWVSCNDTNSMAITSANQGYLVSDGAAPAAGETAEGFTNKIAYHIGAVGYLGSNVADWQFQPTLNEGTNNNYNDGDKRGPIHREIGMRARVTSTQKNAGKRPLEGSYKDTVTVTVQIAA